jgi:hypothetical protein
MPKEELPPHLALLDENLDRTISGAFAGGTSSELATYSMMITPV